MKETSHPFDAAIRWLNSGISEWTKEERAFWKAHPFQPPTDNDGLRAAIRFLEAGKGVDKISDMATLAMMWQSSGFFVTGLVDSKDAVTMSKNRIRALLSALPDKEGGK